MSLCGDVCPIFRDPFGLLSSVGWRPHHVLLLKSGRAFVYQLGWELLTSSFLTTLTVNTVHVKRAAERYYTPTPLPVDVPHGHQKQSDARSQYCFVLQLTTPQHNEPANGWFFAKLVEEVSPTTAIC